MTTLTNDQYGDLYDAVTRFDCEAYLYPDYSGRGMYGEECIGIVCNDPDELMYQLGDYLSGTELGGILIGQRKSHDSMGLQEIVYFPKLQAPPEALVYCEECEERDCICEED